MKTQHRLFSLCCEIHESQARKPRLPRFSARKDASEATGLAAQIPEKVAVLTKLHDVWLADMAKPVKAGEKRYDMAPQAGEKP